MPRRHRRPTPRARARRGRACTKIGGTLLAARLAIGTYRGGYRWYSSFVDLRLPGQEPEQISLARYTDDLVPRPPKCALPGRQHVYVYEVSRFAATLRPTARMWWNSWCPAGAAPRSGRGVFSPSSLRIAVSTMTFHVSPCPSWLQKPRAEVASYLRGQKVRVSRPTGGLERRGYAPPSPAS